MIEELKNGAQLPPYYDQLEVEPDRFVPTDPTYVKYGQEDPHAHLLEIKQIYDVTVDANYPFVDNSLRYKLMNFFYYFNAAVIVNPLNMLHYGFKMRGQENITRNMDKLTGGAMSVCNHVYRWDMCGILKAGNWRQLRFPIFRDQLKGKDRDRMIYTGGVPIPEKLSDLRHFYKAFDYFHEKGYWMHFYAEQSRWQFYTPIRPFKKGAFIFAEKYNLPIIPMAYSYRERKGIFKLFGKGPCITLNIGEPIFADPELKGNRAATIEDLRKRTHEAVVKLAGIKKNPWVYNQTEK